MSNLIEANERQRFIKIVEDSCGKLQPMKNDERDSIILNWTKDLKR
jgi:hypothetical protein